MISHHECCGWGWGWQNSTTLSHTCLEDCSTQQMLSPETLFQTRDQTPWRWRRLGTPYKNGWPERKQLGSQELVRYWKVKDSLTICDQLLLYISWIVVPKACRDSTEDSHGSSWDWEMQMQEMYLILWWPGVMQQAAQVVQNSHECAKQTKPGKEPPVSTILPKFPWQVVGTYLFSCYLKVVELTSTTSATIILVLKSIFARHGIPEVLRSDNGPQ